MIKYLLIPFFFISVLFSENFNEHIHFNPEGPNYVGYIYIGDHESMISQATWLYVQQALEYYKKNKPIFIILELNTPGGEVFAAQKISDALKEMDTQHDVPIIAYINDWAISAGAMLAYASRYITTIDNGIMGAAEPVSAGESGKLETASEKVNSAIRADFASRAKFFGRDPLIAEAMVDKDLILVLRDGKVTKLDSESQIKDTDSVISPKSKLLTLTASEMEKYKVSDLIFKTQKKEEIIPVDGKWSLQKTVFNQNPFFASIPNAIVDKYQMDWKTQFFVWLASPIVSSLLMMGLIIGAYMEINNPGLSLPGGIAALCLFLIVLSSFSLQIANWLELIFLLTGIILILVELFILPTFGLVGIIGIIFFLAGLFGMLLPEFKSFDFEFDSAKGQYFLERLAWLLGSFSISLAIIAILARFLPSLPGLNRFVLAGGEQEASKGYFAGEDPASLPQIGETGEVMASLRPSGKVVINDKIFDAISAGEFIDSGEKIKVVKLDGGVIVVTRDI